MEDEWDDDLREYMKSFGPDSDSDCGCEDGVGNGITNDVDLQYMEFLGNLSEHGSSYVFQGALGNGRFMTVIYEHDDGPVEERNPVDVVDTPIDCPSSTETQKDARSATKASRETHGLSNMASRETQQREAPMVDLSYQTFLGSLRRDGNQMVVMSGINEVTYEQNEESTSDSEVVVLDRDPMSNAVDAPLVICLDDDGTVQNESSKFREGLMEVLQKPYSKREFVKLNTDVRHQRQVEHKRELRSGPKVFPTEFKAKSYLELHPDLKEQIQSAKLNKPMILNLLRGFFYWLKHVTNNARFKPWLDASCLAVQPPTIDVVERSDGPDRPLQIIR